MMIIYANPSNACHATLMVAILAGFASGFVVTQEQMPIGLVSSVLKLVFSSQGRLSPEMGRKALGTRVGTRL